MTSFWNGRMAVTKVLQFFAHFVIFVQFSEDFIYVHTLLVHCTTMDGGRRACLILRAFSYVSPNAYPLKCFGRTVRKAALLVCRMWFWWEGRFVWDGTVIMSSVWAHSNTSYVGRVLPGSVVPL